MDKPSAPAAPSIVSLRTLEPAPGSKKKPKLIGRGPGSGHGKTSARGGKGQTARSGGKIPADFEGGQTPMIRRTPKRGFRNGRFRTRFAIVHVGDLGKLPPSSGGAVTPAVLRTHGLLHRGTQPVKLLGDGEVTAALKVAVHAVSASARKKIESAGGTVELIGAPTSVSS